MDAALAAWAAGNNVVVQAVPGAGKSRLLIELCKLLRNRSTDGLKVLVLAYNKELASDLSSFIKNVDLEAHVDCFTFHALCTHCVRLTADDETLEEVLDGIEAGHEHVKTRMKASAVLVDEAQDVNKLHIRTMTCCIEPREDMQYAIVGDAMQTIYDYAESSVHGRVLARPNEFLVSTRCWTHASMTTSHRITPSMADLVSSHFGTTVQSAKLSKSTTGAPDICVSVVRKWHIGSEIVEIVRRAPCGYNDIAVLWSTRTRNVPMKVAINHISHQGIPINVHGLDKYTSRVQALISSTWHASKGTERHTCIVVVPSTCDSNRYTLR